MSTPTTGKPAYLLRLSILLCVLGIGLRALGVEWQPLWWDEGYSVYFATEPLGHMLRLTAQDIHPPLYYALLHFWLLLAGSASPLVLRGFSIAIGLLALPILGWLGRLFFPARSRVMLLALLLLAVSPIHIFYSQEVRMYGLEMLLGMVSTAFFWQIAGYQRRTPGNWAGYMLATTALLYTEYYAVLLPLTHGVWWLWHLRQNLRQHVRQTLFLAGAWLAVAMAYLPWLLYAVPQLIPYVSQKIVEDADRPLSLSVYMVHHLLAFTAGHVSAPFGWLFALYWLAPVALVLLFVTHLWHARRSSHPTISNPASPVTFLGLLLLVPAGAGFALNLRLPFFPEGGERVLLFVLPYFLLLVGLGVDDLLQTDRGWSYRLGAVVLGGLLVGALAGVWTFFTVPRYVEDDYRPLIRQTIQQGSDTDTVLAVFPWQVGYWRAYAPVWGQGELHGPWPLLTPSTEWDDQVQQTVDHSLDQGKLWFPAHLSLGGILESQIEDYLRTGTQPPRGQVTLNFDNRWYSTTTRLSGWARSATILETQTSIDFSAAQLGWAGLESPGATAANDVLTVALVWEKLSADPSLRVSLRLEDEEGRVWAQRDYLPLGGWPPDAKPPASDQVGLLVPPGVPPGNYLLKVGVGPAEDDWLFLATTINGTSDMVAVGATGVQAPSSPLPALRLPMQNPLANAVERQGIAFLGSSGFDPSVATLAGAEMNLSLFVQKVQAVERPQDIYFSVLDQNGDGVAGWEGWPLAAYPLALWPMQSQVRLPVRFFLPADLSPGPYQVVAGVRDPSSGSKSVPVRLGQVQVVRREASFVSSNPQHLFAENILFGSHAILLGYDSAIATDGSIDLTLYWQVQQTLLPPHNVFLHLSTEVGLWLGQDDGVPGRQQVAAPSNTWIPGEIIADPHTLIGPFPPGAKLVAQVGLYNPLSGVRLPVSVNGAVVGDGLTIDIKKAD